MTDFTVLPPAIERDYWGRPLVVPPEGGKRTAYTRCTTFVGGIGDTYMLGQWQQRHVAHGVARHDDLIAAFRDADPKDKTTGDALVEEAKKRSGAGDAARMGTYLHSVTEAFDRGLDPEAVELPWQSTGEVDPMAFKADLAAYVEATAELTAVSIEQFSVNDFHKVGGTPDRVVKYQGKRYIADLKTGSVEHGALKIAAQLAMYARSRPYDVATEQRMEHHGAELDRGIVVHLPAGSGSCTLYWVDLLQGWEAVKLCRQIREARKLRMRQLFRGLAPLPVAPVSLADQIKASRTPDAVRALWTAHSSDWTPELTSLAKEHIAALGEVAPSPTPTPGGN